MNWADAMKENARLASRERPITGRIIEPRDAPTSWEPHEVWLTRVKLPRDRAALKLADNHEPVSGGLSSDSGLTRPRMYARLPQ